MTTEGSPPPEDLPGSEATGPIGQQPIRKIPLGQRPFETYMTTAGAPTGPAPETTTKTGQISPLDLAKTKPATSGPTLNALQEQTLALHSALGDVSTQLNTPNLKLKRSSKYILKNKLTAAKAHIKAAAGQLGANPVEDTPPPENAGPIQRFLAMITDGQKQLEDTRTRLESFSATDQSLSPADMLLLQIT